MSATASAEALRVKKGVIRGLRRQIRECEKARAVFLSRFPGDATATRLYGAELTRLNALLDQARHSP